MLIADHAHTRHRDFCVVLGQLRRALHSHAPRPPQHDAPRPLVIVEHMYVPTGASTDAGGEGLAPMLRTFRQFLCAISIDDGCADVLVLAPRGTAAGDAAANAWYRASSKGCAERLGQGVVGIALSQSEAVDSWLDGIRMETAARRREERKRLERRV
eukprot:4069148-Prymnesium_polylepis.1